jgi:hypothetical protein
MRSRLRPVGNYILLLRYSNMCTSYTAITLNVRFHVQAVCLLVVKGYVCNYE